jgi:dihydropteroate synthase
MRKTYFRPAGLAYGADAMAIIQETRGASLGGFSSTAYTLVETIERDGSKVVRRFEPFSTAHPRFSPLPNNSSAHKGEELSREKGRGIDIGIESGRPLIMGIVNVTPDSFSDGGKAARIEDAIAHGLQLAKEGADILDVGGESTRPGSDGVDLEEELARVIPVIEALSRAGHRISCDTRKARVMAAALAAGASIINDVSALQHDPKAIAAMAKADCPVVLMHAQGDPRTMQLAPHYEHVALDVYDALETRIAQCVAAGIAKNRLIADPGIGFGKSFRHNLDLLKDFTLFHGLGVPLLMGLSRKGFIGALTGEKLAANRVNGSVGGAVWAAFNGAHILRVHDVKATVEALAVAQAAADPDQAGL